MQMRVRKQSQRPESKQAAAPVVVVGAGPAGLHFVRELLTLTPQQPVVIYGDEKWNPYNRVKLSGLLSGEYRLEDVETDTQFLQQPTIQQRYGQRIVGIDTDTKTVYTEQGESQSYSKLILATGSAAHIPNIPGVNRAGVYNYRDLDDIQSLAARQVRSRKVVVLGGGLLGLEAARAMQRYQAEVTVVDHMPHLMSRQLDSGAAELLREHILSLGIRVILGDPVQAIEGDRHIASLQLRSGRELECDTLILATGIKPNIELASLASLSFARGIKVNERMQTSDEDIYAIGECAEFNGKVYGIVAPGLEQASIAAHNIVGKRARYTPSVNATQLKVVGQKVYSLGSFGEGISSLERDSLCYTHPERGLYRRLEFRRGRIIGAVVIGDWPQLARLQEAVINRRHIWPWQKGRFLSDGDLWQRVEQDDVRLWPARATVCNCTGVQRGQLSEAISRQGCSDVAALRACTGASSVCGSCEPLLAQMLGGDSAAVTEGASATLPLLSAFGLILGLLFLFLSPIASLDSVQVAWAYDRLWLDGVYKQISGYGLLSLALLGGVMSLRKRLKRFTWGNYTSWRLLHIGLGLGMWLLLMAHTGFSSGENFNTWLLLSFLLVMLQGSLAGLALGRRSGNTISRMSYWGHVVAVWPLPVLLMFHIISVYYF